MGVLMSFIIGYWCNWWQLSGIIMVIVVPFVIGMYLVPESPHWYFSKNREQDGHAALAWIHGADRAAISYELDNIKKSLRDQQENKISFNVLLERSILKPFLIALTMFFFLNLCGLNIMIFYCEVIFKYSGSSIDSKLAAIIVGIVLLVSSFVAIIAISKYVLVIDSFKDFILYL